MRQEWFCLLGSFLPQGARSEEPTGHFSRYHFKRVNVSHDDALLCGIDLAVLVDAGHELVVALLGLDFVREPFFEEGGHFVVEVVCEMR